MQREILSNAASVADSDPAATEPTTGISPRKLAANRANAKASTGPTTERGKQIARTNSLKHGLFAKQLVMAKMDQAPDYADFEQLLGELSELYPPANAVDQLRLEKIAINLWRVARAHRIELYYTDGEKLFANSWSAHLVRYASVAEKLAADAFATLQELERARLTRQENDPEGVAAAPSCDASGVASHENPPALSNRRGPYRDDGDGDVPRGEGANAG